MNSYTTAKQHLNGCDANTISFGTLCHWVSFMFIFLVTCPNYGQELPKKPVTEKEYHLWGILYADKISNKGKWVSYTMRYEEGQDTLFVKRCDTKKIYSFAKSGSGAFCGERHFACVNDKGTLQLLDLEKENVTNIENVESYSFSGNCNYLITLEGKSEQKTLCIRNSQGQLLDSITGVAEYKQNNTGDAVLCSYYDGKKYKVMLITFAKSISKFVIAEEAKRGFSQLVWSEDNQSVVFFKDNKDSDSALNRPDVVFFSVKDKRLFQFESVKAKEFPSYFYLENGAASGLTISPDNQRVFFTIRKEAAIAKTFDGIQVWNGNDAVVYPERRHSGDGEFNTKMAVWWPEPDKFMQITDDEQPFGFLNGSQDFALTYCSTDLKPQYKLDRNVNYYVTNLKTGKRNFLLEDQSTQLFESSFSPNGKYFAYFKENNWWVYNFSANKHTNVTTGLRLQTINTEEVGGMEIYGVAGWGVNDEYLLLYDQYDIWKISFDNVKPIRLTYGRERKIVFRVIVEENSTRSNFDGHGNPIVDVNKKVLLKGTKDNETGYFLRFPNGDSKTLVFNESHNSGIVKAVKNDVFLFQSQKYDSPPELIVCNENAEKTKLFQSNVQHYNYAWGKQEMISYRNSKNVPLNGILYYPTDYNPSKKYPMIVYIYEKQSYLFNYYFNPSFYNMAGFNVANLTAKGYFVLLPDIVYELGNPGPSATDCVTAATKEVIRKGVIDSGKIGLIGHSFGGYETNFIIGQTNLFACAISGASVADLVGWYLSIGWVAGRPEIWRNESQQWRMGKSLFQDRKGYERNSPLTYVDKIETPVLIWTGEQDRQIHYYQSIAFYLALRRLQKKEIMLVYPGEGHALLNKENQIDLAHRIEDWFGYYLKGEDPKSWIKEGTK